MTSIDQYAQSHSQEALDLLIRLAQIPAPSNQEQQRAEFCRQWLLAQGAQQVYVDEALNVVLPFGCDGTGPIRVFMAHSDVVFPDTDPLPLYQENRRLYCPGIGDDTANAVALLMAAKYILQNQITPEQGGVLLVINSGEEGLGNLKGCRKIMSDFGPRIREFVSFDGTCRSVVAKAVGSRRYEIEIRTMGGHSYGDFGNPNAIALLSELVHTLYQIPVPPIGKTTFNVGMISGGTSVNTIAQQAKMLFEFRSDEAEGLQQMQAHLDSAISALPKDLCSVSVSLVGERPCSGPVDQEQLNTLVQRVKDRVSRYYGHSIPTRSGSTDCNIPLSLGIPAACVGCYEGAGAHTREEYVEIDSLTPGLKLALDLILQAF